jgi:hypothetical protein
MIPIAKRWLGFIVLYLALISPQFTKHVNKHWFRRVQPIPAATSIILCSSEDDAMNVTSVSLSPDPPAKGADLTVSIRGELFEPLNVGAYLVAKVKKGTITFPQIRFSACDYIVGGCPVAKNITEVNMLFQIPKYAPGGEYDVKAMLYNVRSDSKDDEMITKMFEHGKFNIWEDGPRVACIQASINL